jgi:isoquinoline 1-oxidoreductase beta subunit
MKGREALKIDWNPGPNGDYDSVAYRASLEASVAQPGPVVHSTGDIDAALAGASRRLSAQYYLPHLAHATLETPSATIRGLPGGRWEAWACVQDPQASRDVLSFALGAKPETVAVHPTLLGGGFGRKSMPDFVAEAGMISKAVDGAPVKVIWTREDDLRHDWYHTVSVERLEAGLDAGGRVTAWRHRTCAPSLDVAVGPDPGHEDPDELGMGAVNLPFQIPVVRIENPGARAHTRIGWFRSVSNLPHAFAIQCFVAELAHAAGRDHRDFLLELIGPPRRIDPRTLGDNTNYEEDPALYPFDTGRLRGVIEAATAAIGWGRTLPAGRGLGFAAHYSFMSYAACAMEVETPPEGGVRVLRADVAMDCGPAINPDRVRAQAEGAVIMGMGAALTGEISFKAGAVQQGNFDTFPIPRMTAAPRILNVRIMDAPPGTPPGGVGEPALPPVAPALLNAIFAASGKRIRDLPIGGRLKA